MTEFLSELRAELLDGLERYERAPWWRRPPRIGLVTRRTAAVAVAVAVAVAALVLATHRPSDLEQSTTPPVTRLEGFHASGLVEVGGTLWVAEPNSDSLLRIDLATGKILKRIDVGGSPGTVIAVGSGIWVQDWSQGRLVKVDPRTNRIVKTLALPYGGTDMAIADGSLWTIGGRGVLLRIDPATGTVSRRVPIGIETDSTAPAVTAAGDTLWVTAGSAILEFDARTERVLGRARGPFLPLEFARRAIADAGGLWISSPTVRQVIHVDARTRRVTHHPVGGDPSAVAIVDGRLWVATVHDDNPLTQVTVLDAAGRVTDTIPVPHPAAVIAPSPRGGAWVTFGEDGTFSPAAVHLSGP